MTWFPRYSTRAWVQWVLGPLDFWGTFAFGEGNIISFNIDL
jgi:hypothetical protein